MKCTLNMFTKKGEEPETIDYDTFKRFMSSPLSVQTPYRIGKVIVAGGEYVFERGKDQTCISLITTRITARIRAYDDTVLLSLLGRGQKRTQCFSIYNKGIFEERGGKIERK